MRSLPLKEPIAIHSAVLFYDEENEELLGYGGSDESSSLPAYLYRLKLGVPAGELYEWSRTSVNCPQHQGFVWQHSAHLSTRSFFSGQEGRFLTVIGGCRFSHSPYNSVVEIDLKTLTVGNSLQLDQGLVSQDSVVRGDAILVFGGANGGNFSETVYVIRGGAYESLPGHRAIGCCCLLVGDEILVYGGVSGPASLNGAYLYS
ncbi:unnamed protein product [Sphagnum balticum]